jgi:transposase
MDEKSVSLFIRCGDLNDLVPSNHPLRTIRRIADEVLISLRLGPTGVAEGNSIAAEKLLRAILLQRLYSIPSERQLLERLEFDELFRWFAGIVGSDPILEHRTFSEHRRCLLSNGAAMATLEAVLAQSYVQDFLVGESFSADGSLYAAWASMTAAYQGESHSVRVSHDDQDQVGCKEQACLINFDVPENRSDHLTTSDAPVLGDNNGSPDRFVGGHGDTDPFCLLTVGVREQIALPSAQIGPLHPDDRPAPVASGANSPRRLRLTVAVSILGAAIVGTSLHLIEVSRGLAFRPVVDSIILAESSGCTNAKNERSTALGPGQFLKQTWLELIRTYRPDLAHLGEAEILELRRDPQVSREMTIRFAERNSSVLRARGLPVTPGSVYLSHFAGPAGAVAVLTAPDDSDAATVMANADASGRATRDEIVNANPFLRQFTIGDLKLWADGKMQQMRRNEAAPRQC